MKILIISIFFIIIIISIFKYVNDTNILTNKKNIDIFCFLKENKKRTPQMVFDLAEIYYNGIEQKITPKGYIQKGIKKDDKLALKYYYKLLSNKKYRDICIFRIAEIYYTSEKYRNLEKSKKMYLLLLNSTIMDIKINSFEKIQNINLLLNLPILQDLIFFEENSNSNLNLLINSDKKDNKTKIPIFITQSIRNDSQNVHDSTVVKTLKNKLDFLKKEVYEINKDKNNINTPENTFIEMKKLIEKCNKYTGNKFKISKEKIKNTLKNLNKMYDLNTFIKPLDCSERDVINIVYNKYINMEEKDKSNFINNIVLQLSDADIMCAQGRVSRVLTSINDSEDIKPLWVIRQEMMNKAPLIRKELIEKEKLNEDIINNPKTITEEHISELFDKEFKFNIRKIFEKEYVETGVLTKETLYKELDSWLI